MSWDMTTDDGVAVVTMSTNKVNAQNEEMPPCAVVLTGTGSIFSAGLDLKYTLPLFATRDREAIDAWFERYRATNVRLFSFGRPLVPAVDGYAYAGGLITALCCDYRIGVHGESKFALNEVPIGISMPALHSEIIRHAIGTPNASLTTIFGETFGTEDALRLGLVHQLVEADDLLDVAIARARVPNSALKAYALAKQGLQAPTMWIIENLADPFDRSTGDDFTDPGSLEAQREKLVMLTAPNAKEIDR